MRDDIRDALDHISEIERQISEIQRQLASLRAVLHPTALEPAVFDLEGWLKERRISIKQTREQIDLDPTMDRFARVLGERFVNLRPFYDAIKRRVGGTPHPQYILTQKWAAAQVSDITQFGNDLLRHGFLTKFQYVKAQGRAYFDPQEDGRVTNFFTGNWLERYVVLKVREYLVADNGGTAEIKMLVNPQVLLPNGRDFELDVLIGTPSIVLWLECKTGRDYAGYIKRYKAVAENMCISREHCALVLLEPISDEQKRSLSTLSEMSVINPVDLEGFLERAVAVPASVLPATGSASS